MTVSNTQLYLAIGVPLVANAAMLILGFTMMNSHLGQRLTDLDKLFTERLRRVEEVLDARLKHLEERLP